MSINELKIDLKRTASSISIVGRPDVLSRTVDGNWATSFKGRGLEFTGYRQYTFSDDASQIDWKASLRSKDVLLREFEEFKNFEILFVLDTSDNMLLSSNDKLKVEYAAELLFILSQAALRAGDSVGLAMFNDGVVSSLAPSIGAGVRALFERDLLTKNSYGGPRNFKKSLLEINSSLSSPTILLIFSDFMNMPSDWERYISLLSSRHHVYGMMVVDERDLVLPSGHNQFFLKDPSTGETLYVDSADFAKEYERLSAQHVDHVRTVFKKVLSDCVVLKNGDDPTKDLQNFFNRKRHVLN